MEREEFIKEMKEGFGETMKGVLSPYIEDKIEGLDDITSLLAGQKWHELPELSSKEEWHFREFHLGKNSFYLISQNGYHHGIKKQCPTCKSMITITTFDKRAKCFICDQSLSLEDFTGDLIVSKLKIEKKRRKWRVLV